MYAIFYVHVYIAMYSTTYSKSSYLCVKNLVIYVENVHRMCAGIQLFILLEIMVSKKFAYNYYMNPGK